MSLSPPIFFVADLRIGNCIEIGEYRTICTRTGKNIAILPSIKAVIFIFAQQENPAQNDHIVSSRFQFIFPTCNHSNLLVCNVP